MAAYFAHEVDSDQERAIVVDALATGLLFAELFDLKLKLDFAKVFLDLKIKNSLRYAHCEVLSFAHS